MMSLSNAAAAASAPARTAQDLLGAAAELSLFVVVTSAKAQLVLTGTLFGTFSGYVTNVTLLLVPASIGLCLNARARRWLLLISAVVLSALFFADKVHYRAFHELATAGELGHAGQLMDVFAGIFPYVRVFDLWWIADWPIWFLLFFKRPRVQSEGRLNCRAVRVIAAAIVISVLAYVHFVSSYLFRRLEKRLVENRGFAVREVGLLNFHLFDLIDTVAFSSRRRPVNEETLSRVKHWFRERQSNGNELVPFGIARGFNVIFIQVESLEAFLIGLKIDGQEITPTLNRLTTNSFYFRLFFPQSSLGSTSDAEFCALNSLLPARKGTVARNYSDNTFRSLPTILRERDYDTISMSVCLPNLWNMGRMHRAYGFRRRYYYEHFAQGPEAPLSIPDDRFLAQARITLKEHRQPFFAHLMTISTHTPFTRFPAEQKRLKLKDWDGAVLGNYLQAAHFVDQSLGAFLDGLKKDGMATNTVLVIYGDHQAVPDEEWMKAAPFAEDTAAIGIDRALRRRVPAFIVVPGVSPKTFLSRPAGQVDLTPTVLHLLGIPNEAGVFIGQNLFRDTASVTFFRNGSFITETHFSPERSDPSVSPQCLTVNSGSALASDECDVWRRLVEERISVSDLILENNLIPQIRK